MTEKSSPHLDSAFSLFLRACVCGKWMSICLYSFPFLVHVFTGNFELFLKHESLHLLKIIGNFANLHQ